MKILWHSNWPLAPTGYGSQTALWAPRFRDLGHEVAISSCWGFSHAAFEWEGMNVYPADDDWGNRTLPSFAYMHGDGEECQVITLVDTYVLTTDELKKLRVASWTPVDHDPVPPAVLAYFHRSGATPIAMSRFGERALRKAGLEPLYVPHGIDTNVFKPGDKAAARAELDIPEDAFVVGMVAANKGLSPCRKAFPQVFQAFARFREDHRDAILYLHTERSGRVGVNLNDLALACGIPVRAVRYCDQLEFEFGVKPEKLATAYNAMDVLANPSFGEGFGIPIVEAQACGVPVIVTDWTAMPELCGSGWLVDGDRWYDPTQASFFKCPTVEGIVKALEEAYSVHGEAWYENEARRFALDYDADRVLTDYWVPALDAIEQAAQPTELREIVAA